MKSRISFVCQECGYDSPEWLGKCPECSSWNSLREIKVFQNSSTAVRKASSPPVGGSSAPKKLNEIKLQDEQRLQTGFSEVDMVLGGGIVKGSVILLAGDPGIGKSTLLLQIALNMSRGPAFAKASAGRPVLYISGEESEEQIKLRAQRINGVKSAKNLFILSSTSTDVALVEIEKMKPSLIIVDSIQTMESENVSGMSGSIPQIRYNTSLFIKFAKSFGIPVVLVGHVTKEGMVAGPMILSHMVDSVLFLEGEKVTRTRILRSLKNRFGPVDEIGILLMGQEGIKEVKHSDQLFLSNSGKNSNVGSIIVVTLEGSRAFLVEIQALVVRSQLPFPRRVTLGVDSRRLELLLAVLQKHSNFPLATFDVFVNVAGGLRISDPAADLGICLAIVSSFKNVRLRKTVAISEVGLLGELREVSSLDKRVREARKLGFRTILSAKIYKNLNEVIKSL